MPTEGWHKEMQIFSGGIHSQPRTQNSVTERVSSSLNSQTITTTANKKTTENKAPRQRNNINNRAESDP